MRPARLARGVNVEAGNTAAKAGKRGATIQSILADLKPEAAYFTDESGQRTAFIVVEMQDASQILAIAEPWFLAFNASSEIHPDQHEASASFRVCVGRPLSVRPLGCANRTP